MVRLGIIGLGGLAESVHLPSLADIGNVQIRAVSDDNQEKYARAAASFALGNYHPVYHRMLEQETLDGVMVLTQPDRLYRIVMDVLDAGLPVFMEKPPGITLFQAESIKRKADEKGLSVQVGFNRRFIPAVRESLRILREHTEVTQVEGRFYKNSEAAFYGGCASAFTCDTIHSIDLMRSVAGADPCKGALIEEMQNDIVPNVWNGILKFRNGITGVIRGHYKTGARVHDAEFHGSGGSLYLNMGFADDSCGARIILHEGKGTFSISAGGNGAQKIIHINGKECAGSDKFYRYYGFYDEDLEFINSIMEKRKPSVTIEDGINALRVVEFLMNNRIN